MGIRESAKLTAANPNKPTRRPPLDGVGGEYRGPKGRTGYLASCVDLEEETTLQLKPERLVLGFRV